MKCLKESLTSAHIQRAGCDCIAAAVSHLGVFTVSRSRMKKHGCSVALILLEVKWKVLEDPVRSNEKDNLQYDMRKSLLEVFFCLMSQSI